MDKFNHYLSKGALSAILLLLMALINVGQAVGASLPVHVTNTPLPVREVANPAIQPFQAAGSALVEFTDISKTFTLVTVPAGKRLVIEYAEASGFFEEGTKMSAIITTTVGGVTLQHQLAMIDQGVQSGSLVFVAAQPMRLYADPGTDVIGIVSRGDPHPPGGGGWGIAISGYFVNLP